MLTLSILISIYNNYYSIDNAYYKASLVKVIEVVVLNAILCLYVLYKYKLLLNKLKILIKGPLEVIYIRKTYL